MKIGVLFALAAFLFATWGIINGGWYSLALWPALSFGIVSTGYLYFGPIVFGKRSNGRHSILSVILLLPYLTYMNVIWYLARFLKREAAYDQLTENIVIGRRVLSREIPDNIDVVIDLTCEFTETAEFRLMQYHNFQILDGTAPSIDQLLIWLKQIQNVPGRIYIHCAEGHGRTGLFTAALLVVTGHSESTSDALNFIQAKRPLVRLGSQQRQVLAELDK